MKKYKPTLLIDLDGVLNTYNGSFKEDYIPPIKDGARDFLDNICKNYKLILFTTRDKQLAKQWTKTCNLDKYFIDITNVKIPAYLIIDDRCVCFRGNYDILLKDINNFVVWHKK